MKRVALVGGYWGQNIGNAMFNIGGLWQLRRAFEGAHVELIQDQPGYWTFNKWEGNPKNDWSILSRIECDYLVIQGPLLTTAFPDLWRSTFRALKARGTRIVLLGVALFRFTPEEIEACRAFLRDEVQPVILSTRDLPTYEAFKDCSPNAYAGIDSAFFSPDAYKPFKIAGPRYVAVNFDRFPEPRIHLDGAGKPGGAGGLSFDFEGRRWHLEYPSFLERLSSKNKVLSYLSALLDRRRLPSEVAGLEIVRPEHRFNPHVGWKIYKRPHGIVSDEPWTYYNVYANAELTVSDRVHACVATLAYGKPALLYRHSKRANLFDRLGLEDIGRRVVRLDPARLADEKAKQLAFLSAAWKGLA